MPRFRAEYRRVETGEVFFEAADQAAAEEEAETVMEQRFDQIAWVDDETEITNVGEDDG